MLNCLYIIIGKSGSGKNTLAKNLECRYGYKLAESYTDRPRRFASEEGHVFLTTNEFSAMEGLIAVRTKKDGRYGLTMSMLDQCDLVILDPEGAKEVLSTYKARPVHVIGVHAAFKTRLQRMQGRGDAIQNVELRSMMDDADFMFYEDICDVVVNSGTGCSDSESGVGRITSVAKSVIDQFEAQAWVCTDPDCFQFRRRLGVEINQMPVYELAQVNSYGEDLFRIAHGRVYLSDLDEEEIEALAKEYGWPPSSLLAPNGWDHMAEAVFESEVAEYNLGDKYTSLDAAAVALSKLIGVDVSRFLT